MPLTQLAPIFDTRASLKEGDAVDMSAVPHAADYRTVKDFLLCYAGSQDTFNAYRRELERLLQWSWFVHGASLDTLRRPEIESFIRFCENPPNEWIASKPAKRFLLKDGDRTPNPAWRPFNVRPGKTYTLSQPAVQSIFAILSSFYNYLIQEDLVAYNPVAQIRQKSKFLRRTQGKRPIRRLSDLQWQTVIDITEAMADADPETHERSLFIMSALYGMYLRVSELASSTRWQPKMSDFHRDADGNWWFTTVGKGNKLRDVSVSNAMLECLKRYRLHLGLSAVPSAGDQTPLILKSKGRGAIGTTRQIRRIVQQCFDAAIDKLRKDGFSEEAAQLSDATVHWLRHTGISDDVKTRPREHVRDDAGHSSSAITDKYIDIEMRARHASAKNKVIKSDE